MIPSGQMAYQARPFLLVGLHYTKWNFSDQRLQKKADMVK